MLGASLNSWLVPRSLSVALAACLIAQLSPSNRLFAQGANEVAPPSPQFAPGVLTTIAPDLEPADTLNVHDMVELRANNELERTPNLLSESRTLYEMTRDAEFRQSIWCLEFSFKPLRMMWVDVPQPTCKDAAQADLVHGLPCPQYGSGPCARARQGRHLYHRRASL